VLARFGDWLPHYPCDHFPCLTKPRFFETPQVLITICVHLSRCLELAAVGPFSRGRLAFPAAELIQDRGSPTPIGIFAAMHEQCCDLLPAPLCGSTLQVQGLRNRLTGDGQLQSEAPGVQGRLGPWRTLLRRAEPCIVGVGEESSDNGGDERGMQEGLHRTGALSVDLVQAMDGLVQLDTQFNFPPHPVQISYLSWADPRGEIGEEEAVPLGSMDADQAEMERVLGVPDPHMPQERPRLFSLGRHLLREEV
jgi:hypothetical protein